MNFFKPPRFQKTTVIDRVIAVSEHPTTHRIGFDPTHQFIRVNIAVRATQLRCYNPWLFVFRTVFYPTIFRLNLQLIDRNGVTHPFEWVTTAATREAAIDRAIEVFFHYRQIRHYARDLLKLTNR